MSSVLSRSSITKLSTAVVAGVFACSMLACFAEPRMEVSDVYIVAPIGNAPAALYATIKNETGKPDTLLALLTSVASRAEIHETVIGGDHSGHTPEADSAGLTGEHHAGSGHGGTMSGMVSMKPVPALPVPVGKSVRLMPGSYHGMLFDVGGVHAGDTTTVTLRFSGMKDVSAVASVITYADVESKVGRSR